MAFLAIANRLARRVLCGASALLSLTCPSGPAAAQSTVDSAASFSASALPSRAQAIRLARPANVGLAGGPPWASDWTVSEGNVPLSSALRHSQADANSKIAVGTMFTILGGALVVVGAQGMLDSNVEGFIRLGAGVVAGCGAIIVVRAVKMFVEGVSAQ